MKLKTLSIVLFTTVVNTGIFAQKNFQKLINYAVSPNRLITTFDGYVIQGQNHSGDFIITKCSYKDKVKWQTVISSPDNNIPTNIIETKDSGFVSIGYTMGARYKEQAFINKMDKNGKLLWSRNYGDIDNNEEIFSVTETDDGGFAVTGITSGYASSKYGASVYVVKLDGSGNIQWSKAITSKVQYAVEKGYSIIQTRDKGYAISGISSNGGFKSIFLKLDSAGNVTRLKRFDSFGDGYTIIETNDGGYLISGVSPGAYIIKLKEDGSTAWARSATNLNWSLSNTVTGMNSVMQQADSGYLLPAFYYANNESDFCGLKFDAAGNFKWCKRFGYPGSQNLPSSSGVVGFKYGYLLYTGSTDYMLVNYSASDNYCGGTFLSPDIADVTSQANGTDIDYAVFPGTISAIDAGSTGITDTISVTANVVCSNSVFASNFETAESATSVKATGVKNQLVYPNPAKDILHIQVSGKATFSLINQAGKVLITTTINTRGEINIAHLPAGLYYLKNNATGAVQKVIVNK